MPANKIKREPGVQAIMPSWKSPMNISLLMAALAVIVGLILSSGVFSRSASTSTFLRMKPIVDSPKETVYKGKERQMEDEPELTVDGVLKGRDPNADPDHDPNPDLHP